MCGAAPSNLALEDATPLNTAYPFLLKFEGLALLLLCGFSKISFGVLLEECSGSLCDSGGGFPRSLFFLVKTVRCELNDSCIGGLRSNDVSIPLKPLGLSSCSSSAMSHSESSIVSSYSKAIICTMASVLSLAAAY